MMNPTSLAVIATEIATEWDTSGVVLFKIGVVLLLVLLNGFFVASEFAIVKLRASQLDVLIEEGSRRALLAREVARHMDEYISATQLGITMTGLALGWLGEPYVAQLIEPFFVLVGMHSATLISAIAVVLGFIFITFLTIILGELVPKYLAINRTIGIALFVVPPLQVFFAIFKPAISLLNFSAKVILKKVFRIGNVAGDDLAHSEEELRAIFAESHKAEEVSALGKEILSNALDLRKRVVREIMTPRNEVVFLNLEDSFEENLKRAQDSRHTRFPLCSGHLDNTVGLVHIKDVIALLREGRTDLNAIKRELLPVPEMMSLERLISFFLTHHAHLTIVVDEYGGTVGMVTLDNVLEELVGEIHDEFDVKHQEFRRVSPDEFVADGKLGLYELQDLAGLELESPDVSTVGGYVTNLIGHMPKEGESVPVEGYTATVLKTDGRRIIQVRFQRQQQSSLSA
jgi:CBS domain containing-hemolysin-like protein